MSLTQKGLQERKWGPFPALRQALEDKPLSPGHYGWISTADTLSERLGRLLEIAALATEYGDNVCETARATGWDAMHRDLERLSGELRGLSDHVRHTADEVYALHGLEARK